MAPVDPLTGSRSLRLHAIGHTYASRDGEVQALQHLDLEIESGELVCLVGPSGCGKSTLLDIIAGLRQPTEGWVEIDGRRVVGPSRSRGVVFQQSSSLYPWLTVAQNVELALFLGRVPKVVRRERVAEELRRVGLTDFADSCVWELSGGMQQRCQIARALAADPEVLLLDEPFGALDALTREGLQTELRSIWIATGRTIVFVTHSIEEAALLGSRVLVMGARPGRVLVDVRLPYSRLGRSTTDLRGDADFVESCHVLRAAVSGQHIPDDVEAGL